MGPDKKRPTENTCRIVKGLDAVWAHFCPPKPCLPLSIDGTITQKRLQLELPTENSVYSQENRNRAGNYAHLTSENGK